MEVQNLNTNPVPETPEQVRTGTCIIKCLADVPGGVSVHADKPGTYYPGHLVCFTSDETYGGNYTLPQGVPGDGYSNLGSDTIVGVLKAPVTMAPEYFDGISSLKYNYTAAASVMVAGTVNPAALPFPIADAYRELMPAIVFLPDTRKPEPEKPEEEEEEEEEEVGA